MVTALEWRRSFCNDENQNQNWLQSARISTPNTLQPVADSKGRIGSFRPLIGRSKAELRSIQGACRHFDWLLT
jgi:hypothetical protein